MPGVSVSACPQAEDFGRAAHAPIWELELTFDGINVLEQPSHLRQNLSSRAQIGGLLVHHFVPRLGYITGHVFCRTIKDVPLAGFLEQFLEVDEGAGELKAEALL